MDNIRRGLKSKRAGDYYERLIDRLNTYYLSTDSALIKKRFEPYVRVSKNLSNHRFLAVNTGAAGADFEIFLSNGKSGLFELKYRSSTMITLDAINEKQIDELRLLDRWGFIACILVCLTPKDTDDQWFLIPFRNFAHESKKSLNTKDLQPYKVDLVPNTDLPDLVSKINELYLNKIE
jgi:penicillin-binding protein-related factor A (putative recombinase)